MTIAAPIAINGIKGNMAVVKKVKGHRILMPNGSELVFNKK